MIVNNIVEFIELSFNIVNAFFFLKKWILQIMWFYVREHAWERTHFCWNSKGCYGKQTFMVYTKGCYFYQYLQKDKMFSFVTHLVVPIFWFYYSLIKAKGNVMVGLWKWIKCVKVNLLWKSQNMLDINNDLLVMI